MRKTWIAAAALIVASSAQAMATAEIKITNQTPWQIYALDGDSIDHSVAPVPFVTGDRITAGFAKGYEFDYLLTASDDGLPATPTQQYNILNFDNTRAAPLRFADNYEVGYVEKSFYTENCYQQWTCNPEYVYGWADLKLGTNQDAVADSFSQSGHAIVYTGCRAGAQLCSNPPDIITVSQSAIVSAPIAPVPEPGTWALMACGLMGLLGIRRLSAFRAA